MAIVVDIQGFKIPDNQFIVKELGAIGLYGGFDRFTMGTLIFKPPCTWESLPSKYQTMNTWCTRNLHGIPWDAGNFPYEELKETLRCLFRCVSYIFVKGLEKKRWIENLIEFTIPVINLEDLGCPSLKQLDAPRSAVCYEYHKNSRVFNCAMLNARKLANWYFDRYGVNPSIDKSISLFYHIQDLSKMRTEDVAYLPKDFLLKYAWRSIDRAWDKLPAEMQKDADIATLVRCRKHYRTWGYPVDECDEGDEAIFHKKSCL